MECIVNIDYDYYTTDSSPDAPPERIFKTGDRFVGVYASYHTSGMGSPCKDRAEAIEQIKRFILEHDVKQKYIILTDETDLKINVSEFFNAKTLFDY